MQLPKIVCSALCLGITTSLLAQAKPAPRPLQLDDLDRFVDVADPQLSPDGQWVAYTVNSIDLDADRQRTCLWMVSWDGKQNLRMTYGSEPETAPRWSPDGRYLSFLSSRPGKAKGTQVWALDRRGGEARQLTAVEADLSGYEWSPDSRKLVLVMKKGDDAGGDGSDGDSGGKEAKPIVIDRYHFKQDEEGYLTTNSHSHLYLFDIKSQKLDPLTVDSGYEESFPAWSPDSRSIAFASNHDPDADRTVTADLFVVAAEAGQTPRKLVSTSQPDNQHLAWSPDGKLIAYMLGGEAKFSAYNVDALAVIPAAGGTPKILTKEFDRPVSSAIFSEDGSSLQFLVDDDCSRYPARVPAAGGPVERLLPGALVVPDWSSVKGRTALLVSSDSAAPEIFALESGKLRQLTKHNADLQARLRLGAVEELKFASQDGTEIHGLMVKPPNFKPGHKYPTLLWLHGGPNEQDAHELDVSSQLERQFFAARGYLALGINYRGSAGRGAQFTRSIAGDWGHLEVADLLAGIDEVVKRGLADPGRLGIGGWSYGGLLTDYTIASDTRFKAAISGAGSANQIAMYGVDEYALQYDNEIGPPWRNTEQWMKLSYAFFKADRIRTPTLFLGGDQDFNVPIMGGEQMYQTLQSLKVPTQLVIYPGEHHIFTRPSFIRDRLERDLAWFDKYLRQ